MQAIEKGKYSLSEIWGWKILLCTTLKWSWSCGHRKSFKIPVKELLKKDLLQRYFSRILTTKCYFKLESKVRLVHQPRVRRQRFYALCSTFKLALLFSKVTTWNVYKINLSGSDQYTAIARKTRNSRKTLRSFWIENIIIVTDFRS